MASETQRSSASKPLAHAQNSHPVIEHSSVPTGTVKNRKKAKRRAKQGAVKQVPTQADHADADDDSEGPRSSDGQIPRSQDYLDSAYNPNKRYGSFDYASPEHPDNFAFSDEENEYAYDPAPLTTNGGSVDAGPSRTKQKKKKGDTSVAYDSAQDEPRGQGKAPHRPAYPQRTSTALAPRPISDDALRTVQRGINNGIWNTSSAEERQRIKEYWLKLGEEERKGLVKIEKNDVLKKMKDQQKNSCSCTVCGRKRVAIEEELEVLYDAYYHELEQYANNQQVSENGAPMLPPSRRYSSNSANRPPNGRSARGRILESADDEHEEEFDDENPDREEYSEEDYEDDEYSADEQDGLPPASHEFFTFGKSLTVKGGILTVADDLLKNDGQKFIDMMEQLAERRMAREEQAQYASYPSHPAATPQHSHQDHAHVPPEVDDYEDEEEEDYGSEDEEYDEEDDVDGMTENQRMAEGRRMFQIFAARMFEQRVLTAYREQRSKERSAAFLEELKAEEEAKSQAGARNAARKAKQKEKDKAKKEALKQEKQRKADEKAAAERAEEERKQEEKRKREEENRKREEERKRKQEAIRKVQEDEKQRKRDEDRAREEVKKARDQKIKEKKDREDAARKERERERETKIQLDREEKERQEKARLTKEALEAKKKATPAAQSTKVPAQLDVSQPAEPPRRAPLPAIVALPPGLKSKPSIMIHESPKAKVATPVMPKPPTPVRPKELSSRISQTSTPVTPETTLHSKHSSPHTKPSTQQSTPLITTLPQLRTPSQQSSMFHEQAASPLHSIPLPSGMHMQHHNPTMGMPQIGPSGFSGAQGSVMPGMMHRMPLGHQMPMYQPHGPQMAPHHRPFMNPSAGAPPPGIALSQMQQQNRGAYDKNQAITAPLPGRENVTMSHSRQGSLSFDHASGEPQTPASASQPIARPAPIRPPSNSRSADIGINRNRTAGNDVDELSTRLGSSALLADDDEPLPSALIDTRRVSGPLGSSLPKSGNSGFIASPFDHVQSPFNMGGHGGHGDTWRSSASQFGPPSASGWGQEPSSRGWGSTGASPAPAYHRGSNPRPITVRMLAKRACEELSTQSQIRNLDGGFHDFNDVLRLACEFARTIQESIISPQELRNILDTEGDAHNGGGSFIARDDKSRGRTFVKWQPDAPDPGLNTRAFSGLGQIGSLLPGASLPALGGLGARGF